MNMYLSPDGVLCDSIDETFFSFVGFTVIFLCTYFSLDNKETITI
jgi:hypothetical protein